MMNVYFTVDTESSMAGAWDHPDRRPLKADKHIFCEINGRDHGIGLITDALSRYGFRGTFFVETLMTLVNGADDVKRVFEFLLRRDQDVQLHLHPTYRFYADALAAREARQLYHPPDLPDTLSCFDESQQMDLLVEAVDFFRGFSGSAPVAFRAGSFAANDTTLRCLRSIGIPLDSSFNPCYPRWSFPGTRMHPNQIMTHEGVWEVPVTVARTRLPEGHGGLKHADPCALSVSELRAMLEYGFAAGQKHFVIIFHGFAAVKAKDMTYREMRPDRLTIRRLHQLFAYLHSHTDKYRVATFGDLGEHLTTLRAQDGLLAELPLFAAGVRKAMQAVNRAYWV